MGNFDALRFDNFFWAPKISHYTNMRRFDKFFEAFETSETQLRLNVKCICLSNSTNRLSKGFNQQYKYINLCQINNSPVLVDILPDPPF